jgi:hypothetical protein
MGMVTNFITELMDSMESTGAKVLTIESGKIPRFAFNNNLGENALGAYKVTRNEILQSLQELWIHPQNPSVESYEVNRADAGNDPRIFKCILYVDDELVKVKIHAPEFPAVKIPITNNVITDLLDAMADNGAEGLILKSGEVPAYRIQAHEIDLLNYAVLDYAEMVADLDALRIKDWPGPGNYDRYVHFSEDETLNRELMIHIEDNGTILTVHFEEI